MAFTQILEVDGVADEQALREHLASWDTEQAAQAPGYLGARVLADQERPGSYVLVVDFASQEQAEANNERPETGAWAERLRALASGEPGYRNLRPIYATGD